MSEWEIRQGSCLDLLRAMPDGSAQCCVTSPPYWGLRDYGHEGQLGMEPTPDEFVANLVAVFAEVRRVLRDDGTLWLNLGDSYAARLRQSGAEHAGELSRSSGGVLTSVNRPLPVGFKEKDLVGIPWLTAFALRADGWFLRSEIIWAKPNPMPESVRDRPTKAHEQVFLLSKSARYFYDAEAIKEPATTHGYDGGDYAPPGQRPNMGNRARSGHGIRPSDNRGGGQGNGTIEFDAARRNKRSVWAVSSQPFPGAHFATFPPKLIEPMILAGSRPGDTILDPFSGSGTTGMVALRHDRSYIGLELNPEYVELSRDRIRDDAPLLNAGIEAAA